MLTVSRVEIEVPRVENVFIDDDTLSVDLRDGRSIQVPLAWFPRLLNASAKERSNWRLVGDGQGIHWEDLDEDVSLLGLLEGKSSMEGQFSFQRWLAERLAIQVGA